MDKISFVDKYKSWNMKDKYDYYKIKKIGYLDIETSGLNADFGIILSWANLTRDVKTGKTRIKYDFVEKKDFDYAHKMGDANLIDKRICESDCL